MKEFDFNREKFENQVPLHGYFMKRKAKSIIKNTAEGLRCLDIGCGSGKMEQLIHSHFKQIVGIDTTPKQIKEAKKLRLRNCEFKIGSATKLPFKNNSFDAVIIVNVLHHLKPKDYFKVISEARRVLKPKGVFLIYEHNPLHPLVWLRFYYFSQVDKGANMLSPYGLRSLCKKKFSSCKVRFIMSEGLGEYFLICQ